jgi:uncharacterized repeat protein (TIGR01451 family)
MDGLAEPKPLGNKSIKQVKMEGETGKPSFADFPAPPMDNGNLLESFANPLPETTGKKSDGFSPKQPPLQPSYEPPLTEPKRQPPLETAPNTALRTSNGSVSGFDTNTPNTLRADTKPVPPPAGSLSNADPFGTQQPVPAVAPSNPIVANVEPADTRIRVEPSRRTTITGDEGTGQPGPSSLEGPQTAHLTIEKVLPEEVKIGETTTIQTVIKNVGRSSARNIVLKDKVPQGAKLVSTSPETAGNINGDLTWSLGNLDGNEKITVEMRIIPLREGEIGSVAHINYSAEASAKIEVTRPMLKVEVKAPQEVRYGEIANVEITISNPGTATASGIILEEYVPDGLYHKDGKILVNKNVDSLRPKEAKRLTLPLSCTGHGNLVNRLIVKANGNLSVEEKTTIRALAPILELGITGPQQQFLERKTAYRLVVANKGTSSARNIDLVATLPEAVKFVSTNQSGVYEPQTHTVHWALEELPAQESGEIELNVLPAQTGDHSIRFKGVGQNNLKEEVAKQITIGGLPALSFEVVGSSNLVELNKDIVYEIRVQNKGTKRAENVKVRMNLSDGLQFTRAEAPVRYQANGGIVLFEGLPQLEPKGEKVFRVSAKCLTEGDHRISVQVVSDDLRSPITKEESTRVFK